MFLNSNPVSPKVAEDFRNADPKVQKLCINKGGLESARDADHTLNTRIEKMTAIAEGRVNLPPGDWICISCGDHQFMRNQACRKCKTPKPQSAKDDADAAKDALRGGAASGSGAGLALIREQSPIANVGKASPGEIDEFFMVNDVRVDTQERFRGLDPRIQRCVLNRGNLEGARDPTAAFISRMTEVERIANGQYVLPPGDWICINCADHQYMRNDRCRKCGGPRPAEPQQTPSEWGSGVQNGSDTGPAASEWNTAPTALSEWNAGTMQSSEAMQAMAVNMAGVAEASVVAEELPEMDVAQMRQQMMQMQQQMNIMASMMQSMAQMAGMQQTPK